MANTSARGITVSTVGLVPAIRKLADEDLPLTFALTLFVYQILGYTLNRVTLFALIFVTGIVVDDSIIVAENIRRSVGIGGWGCAHTLGYVR